MLGFRGVFAGDWGFLYSGNGRQLKGVGISKYEAPGGGTSLKLHGHIEAQREIELKDGAISAVTRVFDALWRRRLRRSPKAILDFSFSLRCGRACNLRAIGC
jgi:hypothetical protein